MYNRKKQWNKRLKKFTYEQKVKKKKIEKSREKFKFQKYFWIWFTLTWVSVKSLDLTLKRTLSSFSRGPTRHLRTVQRLGSHPSSSDWNSARERFLLQNSIFGFPFLLSEIRIRIRYSAWIRIRMKDWYPDPPVSGSALVGNIFIIPDVSHRGY